MGYLQLDGDVSVPGTAIGYGTLAPAVGDANRRRYAYWPERDYSGNNRPPACEESTVPVLVFLYTRLSGVTLDELGVTYTGIRPDDQVFDQRSRVGDLFYCPSTDRSAIWAETATVGRPSLHTSVGGGGPWTPWWTRFDYATNAGLLGFHHDARYADRRYAGRLARVRGAASLLLLSDTSKGVIWQPTLEGTAERVTLADAGDAAEVEPLGPYLGSATPPPHGGRINAAFVDGHVEALAATPEDLSKAALLQR